MAVLLLLRPQARAPTATEESNNKIWRLCRPLQLLAERLSKNLAAFNSLILMWACSSASMAKRSFQFHFESSAPASLSNLSFGAFCEAATRAGEGRRRARSSADGNDWGGAGREPKVERRKASAKRRGESVRDTDDENWGHRNVLETVEMGEEKRHWPCRSCRRGSDGKVSATTVQEARPR